MTSITIDEVAALAAAIRAEVARAVVGQEASVETLLVALFAGGHVLLEGPPGTAKTLLAHSFARASGLGFGRIQFTPDLMPGDIIGANLFNFQTSSFTLTRGPIFTDLLLADEINRTPPKTQAALLEAMQERTVTIDGDSLPLGPRFTVIATQNPIEQQGVYPLPEAQLDRFLFKQVVGYPSAEEERRIIATHGAREGAMTPETWGVEAVTDGAAIGAAVAAVAGVRLVDEVIDYVAALVRATRDHADLMGGASPRAGAMLAGAARADDAPYKPTKAGGGGPLKLLFWQGPTLLNPHFATGTKDQEAGRIFYEPLAAWNGQGELVPVLAASIPSAADGSVAADGRSVVWKLKPGVRWHDGQPLTADDLVFTWTYAKDPAAATVSVGTYKDITVEKIDDLTVKVVFPKPTPFWADAFVGTVGSVLPRHVFADYTGAKSRDAPANLRPVGTGPYTFVDFRPGDLLRGERNRTYHAPDRPYFDTIELKGGGDAVSAARAVLQTGEYDYAWNIQVEDEVLKRFEEGGKGRVEVVYGGNLEFVLLNATDPDAEVDGERSSLKTEHFAFKDPAVRQAMSLLIDRDSIEQFIYGRTGETTANTLTGPARFVSHSTRTAFDVAKANALLDAAGWARGPDGIRAKDGRRMHFVFQTSINAPRQKTQAIIKQAAGKAGIDLELKSVTASVFFSSDVANPDTYPHFYADMEMYTATVQQPDPTRWMLQYASWEVAQKSNKWQGLNIVRWRSDEFDKLYHQSESELDPVKRAALFIRMNDLVVADNVVPLIHRAKVAAAAKALQAPQSGWDNDLWNLPDWWKTA